MSSVLTRLVTLLRPQTLVEARDEYDLDGVDLDVEDGGAPTEIQV